MCGLIGIVSRDSVAQDLHEGLNVLQHRGQDAAGLTTCDRQGRLHQQRGNGLVRDVFHGKRLARLRGEAGIGHLRYPTAGTEKSEEAQPLYVNSPYGIALGHNGNLVNTEALRQELFTASRGEGAWLDNRRMRVSRRDSLEGALIGTGFPFRSLNRLDTYLDIFRPLTAVVAGIRRPGAASLDLAYVAAGRLDGFWEYGLEPWDIAAGTLLIREAGGFVSDMDSGEPNIESGNIVAGNLAVHDSLLEIIRAAQDDRGRT